MGLSASQARFLQLTARRSNVEYQAQQINFERLQLANQQTLITNEYNEKMSNRKITYSFNNGEGLQTVDLTYQNYKNYMNQQNIDFNSHKKMYLVSSSGNKIIVANEQDKADIINANKTTVASKTAIENAKEKAANAKSEDELDEETKRLLNLDITNCELEEIKDDNGNSTFYYINRQFNDNDFMIVNDLEDVDNFQDAILNGIYHFATLEKDTTTNKNKLVSESWDTINSGALTEVYDVSDDKAAESEYSALQSKIQNKDKKLEMELNKLETERNAITTEMEAVQKVIDDNVERSFKAFS